MALWDGRFDGSPAEEMQRFGESLSVDLLMWREDIMGSKAHATMLHQLGINHENFSFQYQGLDMRLTGVEKAKVVKPILS